MAWLCEDDRGEPSNVRGVSKSRRRPNFSVWVSVGG